jgi:hypothetical protein
VRKWTLQRGQPTPKWKKRRQKHSPRTKSKWWYAIRDK